MTLAAKDPEERRRRILAAAVDVLRERGFAGTRVADIAAAAGTSPALVLYHFSSLSDVLLAALTTGDDEFYADLEAQRASAGDARDLLAATGVLGSGGGPAFGDWELWLEIWIRARHDARVAAVRRSLDERWRGLLHQIIDDGVAQGVFRCADPGTAALRLAALMDGLAVQVVLGDAGVTLETMAELWLTSAARELGIDEADLLGRRPTLT